MYNNESVVEEVEKGLSNKIKTYKRIGNLSIAGIILTIGYTVYSFVPIFQIVSNTPEIVVQHMNAHTTLTRLEKEKSSLDSKLQVPYETPEIREALERVYAVEIQKSASLEGAIASMKQEMTKIEANPQYAEYRETQINVSKDVTSKAKKGIGAIIFLMLSAIYTKTQEEVYKENLKGLKKEVTPQTA